MKRILIEQTPLEQAEIDSLKAEGYQEVTGIEYAAKRISDPSGKFEEIGGVYLYKPSEGDDNSEESNDETNTVERKRWPETGFTDEQNKKFRKWMQENHPEFMDDTGEPLDLSAGPETGTVRQAYAQYGKEYRKYLKSIEPPPPPTPVDPNKENLIDYSVKSGFGNWKKISDVEERVKKIIELTNDQAKSKVFFYFLRALEYAKIVYSKDEKLVQDYDNFINQLKTAGVDKQDNPSQSEIDSNAYEKYNLGDTGVWRPYENFFYYRKKPAAKEPEEPLYSESDVNSIFEKLKTKFDTESTETLDKKDARILLDLYAKTFDSSIPDSLCNIKSEEIFLNPLKLNNEEWKKLKQLLADANSKGFFDFGRSEFCRKGLKVTDKFNIAPKVKYDKLFDFFSTIPDSKIRIKPGVRDWRQQEGALQENSLINTVRKNLVVEQYKKEKLLRKKLIQENKIIEDRFKYTIESIGLKNKKDVGRIVEGLFYEMLYLESRKYNRKLMTENIQSILDVLGTVFGGDKNMVINSFKEKGVNYILNKLELDETSYMADFLKLTFDRVDLKDVPRLFTDCEFLTSKISESVPEAYLMNLQNEKGFDGKFMDYVKGALNDVIEQSDLSQKLEERIKSIVCPITEELNSKFEEKLNNMKSSLSQD